LNLVV
jgi:hypothetical protein